MSTLSARRGLCRETLYTMDFESVSTHDNNKGVRKKLECSIQNESYKQNTTYTHRSLAKVLCLFCSGSSKLGGQVRGVERGCDGSRSRKGIKTLLKMLVLRSSATMWWPLERHA